MDWEYDTVTVPQMFQSILELFNAMGKVRWELVTIVVDDNIPTYAVFKRELVT